MLCIANVLERPRAKFLNEHAFGSFKNAGDWILKDVRYKSDTAQICYTFKVISL